MTVIEQIKAEIERLKVDYLNRSYTFVPTAMQQLLDFIDTLESEKPMNPEGLEEEIDKYREEHLFDMPAFQQVARHFAEWQKEQDDRLVDIIYQQGIEKGKDEMREILKRKEKK